MNDISRKVEGAFFLVLVFWAVLPVIIWFLRALRGDVSATKIGNRLIDIAGDEELAYLALEEFQMQKEIDDDLLRKAMRRNIPRKPKLRLVPR